MNILVVGNGGREHALVWKLKQSSKVKRIFVASGNAGTGTIATNIPLSTTKEIVDWLKLKKPPIDLVIIGPDNYLAEGIVDKIQKIGMPVFGPTKAAAEIEWSKSFAKRLMQEEGIPTATFKTFNDINKARAYIQNQKFPLVIKADGLALGKGVIIAENKNDAEKALLEMMADKIYGKAGDEIVVEEYLQGQEISIHAFCDGKDAVLFPASQDHKKIFDGDKGPNTGGMGTIAPVPWVTKIQLAEIKEKIVMPTLRALAKRGRPFQGVLFPGIIFTDTGPKVIEFNARFGDPETQSYMRWLDTDLVDILFACVNQTLHKQETRWSGRSACCIVCASGGYPGKYKKGLIIKGLNRLNCKKYAAVFHAGTKSDGNKILTNGGRILGVSAIGDDLSEALSKGYATMKSISFDGMQFRKDIGKKSLT